MNQTAKTPALGRRHGALWLTAAVGAALLAFGIAFIVEERILPWKGTMRALGGLVGLPHDYEVFYFVFGVLFVPCVAAVFYLTPLFREKAPPMYPSEEAWVAVRALGRAGGSSMNTTAYLFLGYGCLLLGTTFFVWASSDRAVQELFGAAVPLLLVGTVTTAIFWYRAWSAIQDGHARISALAAAGLLLVPVYNLVWVLRMVPAFAVDYNRMLDRHGLRLPRLNGALFTAYAVMSILPGLNFVALACLMPVIIVRTCDVVNRVERLLASAPSFSYGFPHGGAQPAVQS